MKKVVLLAIMLGAAASAKCQSFLFEMNQSAFSYKNNSTGKFVDAEVKDTKATIILRNNQVVVNDSTSESFTLTDKGVETIISDKVTMYRFTGKNEKNIAVSFQYTVNHQTKEAIVELASKKVKSYYFGTFSTPDLTSSLK
ncbi:MAG TPA: hypothetical protein VF623_06775 [Segetibacter sp.]